jgi:deoxycytidylate deaminase
VVPASSVSAVDKLTSRIASVGEGSHGKVRTYSQVTEKEELGTRYPCTNCGRLVVAHTRHLIFSEQCENYKVHQEAKKRKVKESITRKYKSES